MTDNLRDEVARRLQEELEQTDATIRSLERQLEPREAECGIGRMAAAEPDGVLRAAEEALRIARNRQKQLLAARLRLGNADFGLCKVCGQRIPAERLLAVPESAVCRRCKG